jgi:splicing factor, arginine/serine-rich 4/5/6
MSMKLFIGRLSHDAVEQDLEDAFKPFGPLNQVVVKSGYGFVEYQNARDAEDAIRDLNGHAIKGSPILVQQAKGPKDNRSRIPKVFSLFGSVHLFARRTTVF